MFKGKKNEKKDFQILYQSISNDILKERIRITGEWYINNALYARKLKPYARGELEITDLNWIYLETGNLM